MEQITFNNLQFNFTRYQYNEHLRETIYTEISTNKEYKISDVIHKYILSNILEQDNIEDIRDYLITTKSWTNKFNTRLYQTARYNLLDNKEYKIVLNETSIKHIKMHIKQIYGI